MAKNQTISFLRDRFHEVGIQPDSRHGQNFLIDMNLQKLLVEAAELDENDVVLEVGTGTGALTELMAERAAAVVTVEIDQHLHQLASELLFECHNVTMLQQDVLKNKNSFDPAVMDAVRDHLAAGSARRFKLCANLPYCVATPVLSNLLTQEPVPTAMIGTIQKELADRIVAQPWSKDYSSLSIWLQSQCDAEIVRLLPPSVFWPRPKVQSAIIKLTVDPRRRAQIPDLRFFHQFVKMMFIHRRKFLRSNLLGAMKNYLDKPQVDEILDEMGFVADTRSEQLDVATMLQFCEAVRKRVPDWKL